MDTQNICDKTLIFLIHLHKFDVNRGIRLFKYAAKRKLGKMAEVVTERL